MKDKLAKALIKQKEKCKDCLLMNNHEIAIKANKQWADIFNEFYEVWDTGILPDGDHVNVSTTLWLDSIMGKINAASMANYGAGSEAVS
jgi:hypothetical protein